MKTPKGYKCIHNPFADQCDCPGRMSRVCPYDAPTTEICPHYRTVREP